ncbi:MAG: hypothetical protein WA110_03280 [Anaerolineaceae bacterium]
MLLEPTAKKESLAEKLLAARNALDYPHEISFKKINRNGWKYELADAWLSIAIGYLRSDHKHRHYYFSGAISQLITLDVDNVTWIYPDK